MPEERAGAELLPVPFVHSLAVLSAGQVVHEEGDPRQPFPLASVTKVLATVVKARKGFHTEVAEWALRQGYTELLVDGQFLPAAAF